MGSLEVGVRTILGQQTSVVSGCTSSGRLSRALGMPVPGLNAFGLTHTFPAPEVLAASDLSNLGLTRTRAAAIRAFACAVADGWLPLDGSQSLEDFTSTVMALPGLGPWTAHVLALRLGERDAFPASDLALRRAYKRLMASTDPSLAKRSNRWHLWRAHAAALLWASDGPEGLGAGDPADQC